MIRDWALMIMIVDIFDLVIRSTLEREGTARNIRIIQDIELSKIITYFGSKHWVGYFKQTSTSTSF